MTASMFFCAPGSFWIAARRRVSSSDLAPFEDDLLQVGDAAPDIAVNHVLWTGKLDSGPLM